MTDKPVDLDQHRGMAAQKATDLRRLLAEGAANEQALSATFPRPKRHLKAAGPSIQLIDRNPSGCPLPSLRAIVGRKEAPCNYLQSFKENRPCDSCKEPSSAFSQQ